MRLEGKMAFVTGASRGIGRGVAERLAQEGANVAFDYVSDAEAAGAAETVKVIEAAGRRALVIEADLRDLGAIAAMIGEAVRQLGSLDVLVNNAGVEHKAAFWDVTEDQYDLVMSVNLKGLFFATQAFVRYLRTARRPGKVINISSVHEDLRFPASRHTAPARAACGC